MKCRVSRRRTIIHGCVRQYIASTPTKVLHPQTNNTSAFPKNQTCKTNLLPWGIQTSESDWSRILDFLSILRYWCQGADLEASEHGLPQHQTLPVQLDSQHRLFQPPPCISLSFLGSAPSFDICRRNKYAGEY